MQYCLEINSALCFSIGALYSFAELLGLFRNAGVIFRIKWGWFYIILNGLLAIFAYFILRNFQLNPVEIEAGRVLLAGGSSMAVIRSYIINVPSTEDRNGKKRSKEHQIIVTPLIQVFLSYVKREFDREKSKIDITKVKKIMEGTDFNRLIVELPFTCSTVMVTLTAEDGREISTEVNKIRSKAVANDVKLLNLGLFLSAYTGHELLKTIVDNIRVVNSPRFEELDNLIESFRDLETEQL